MESTLHNYYSIELMWDSVTKVLEMVNKDIRGPLAAGLLEKMESFEFAFFFYEVNVKVVCHHNSQMSFHISYKKV
jgi:hypothetical protein